MTQEKFLNLTLSEIKVLTTHYDGNEYWCESDEDVNFYATFQVGNNQFNLSETVGYTNGGASWSSVCVTNSKSEIVYSDSYHNGNDAWQVGDSFSSKCDYNDFTNQLLTLLKESQAEEKKGCERCGSDGIGGLHTCPYKVEIHNDEETLCNCCAFCQDECLGDI